MFGHVVTCEILTPIATYVAGANDNTAGETCDEDAIAALEAVILTQQTLIVQTEADIANHEATTLFREGVIAAMEAMLPNLSGKRYDQMVAKIAKWQAKIDTLEGKIMTLEEQLAIQTAELAVSQGELAALQAICDGTTPGAFGLFYLHSDHLGKTQFATDANGVVIWDGGISTPFGESVSLASAFAQNLMFPGQYEDEETGLSHNWHRTYDPTLGRYLQSDPIGLAGGINRYAYVGGNPTSYVDPTGELIFVPVIAGIVLRKYLTAAVFSMAIETVYQAYKLKKAGCQVSIKNLNIKRIAISGASGGFGGLVKGPSGFKVLRNNKKYKDMSSQVYKRPRRASGDPKFKNNLAQVGVEAVAGLGISVAVKKGLNKAGLLDPFEPTRCGCSR